MGKVPQIVPLHEGCMVLHEEEHIEHMCSIEHIPGGARVAMETDSNLASDRHCGSILCPHNLI